MRREAVGKHPAGAVNETEIDCIAHRGFAGVYPENTLAAVRGASNGDFTREHAEFSAGTNAVDAIEIDVLPAAGGEPVVFHDLTLGRLTDAPPAMRRQPVWETPLETLRTFSVLDSSESVSTLADVMDVIPPAVTVNIELKHPGTGQPRRELEANERARGRKRWSGFVERVLAVLADHDNDVLFSSSYEGALAATRAASDLPLAYLFWESIEGGLAITRRYDCEAVNPAMDMITGTTMFGSGYTPTGPFTDIDLVEIAHEEGRTVNVWTVTERQQATQLRAAGVDGIITDYPGLLEPETGPIDAANVSTQGAVDMSDAAQTTEVPAESNTTSGD